MQSLAHMKGSSLHEHAGNKHMPKHTRAEAADRVYLKTHTLDSLCNIMIGSNTDNLGSLGPM